MPAVAVTDSWRRSSSAFTVALAALTSTELISRCCRFKTMSALQAAIADFHSSAAMALASFVDLRSAASWVFVRGRSPARVGQAPGGGMDRDLLELRNESQVLLRHSTTVGGEAGDRSGDGKTGFHIRSAGGLSKRGQRCGSGSSGHGIGCGGGEPGLQAEVVADNGGG